MNPFFVTDFSISDSLKTVRKSVLIYETIITFLEGMPNVLTGEVSVDDYCKQVAPKMQEALDNAIELQNAATNN